MVLRRWPTWNDLAMLGEEYSIMTRLPSPIEFAPYSGCFDAVSYVRAWIWSRMRRVRVAVWHLKWRKARSCVTDSTQSSGWNYNMSARYPTKS